MVRTTLGAEVETDVTVQGSESAELVNLDQSDTVPGGGSEVVTLRPPAGSIFELLSARVVVRDVSSTASDNHDFTIQTETQDVRVLQARGSADANLSYSKSEITSANVFQLPSSTTAQLLSVRGLRASPQSGIQVEYRNFTSTSQTQDRTYRFAVREIQVSE